MTYITGRGRWYDISWKGIPEKSGGVAVNIGIHFFDLLLWLFGEAGDSRVHYSDPHKMAGFVELERAKVKWFLSTDVNDLACKDAPGPQTTFRSITIDGTEIDFTEGFTDLHTLVYKEILAGRGAGINDARPSINLAYRIRTASPGLRDNGMHPYLAHEKL